MFPVFDKIEAKWKSLSEWKKIGIAVAVAVIVCVLLYAGVPASTSPE